MNDRGLRRECRSALVELSKHGTIEESALLPCGKYLVGPAAKTLQGLFPFAKIRSVSACPGEVDATAIPDDDRLAIRLILPFGDGGWHLEITLFADRAIFQAEGDPSKGSITTLAKSFATVVSNDLDVVSQFPESWNLPSKLGAALPTAIVAEFLQSAFNLGFDTARLLDVLTEYASRTYEGKAVSQGFLVRFADADNARHDTYSPLLQDYSKHFLPLSDGYNTAVEISRNGRCLGPVDLNPPGRPRAERAPSAANHPDWLQRIAALTARKARNRHVYAVAIVLTQHGDLLVLGKGALLLSRRAGVWRSYDHTEFRGQIESLLRARGRPPRTRSALAKAIYATALDVSFRHSGGLIGVLYSKHPLEKYVETRDQLVPTSLDLRGVMDRKPFHRIERGVRAALAAIDGAMVVDRTHKLVAFGAVIKGPPGGGTTKPEGARTRAARRLSKGGMAVKISADGEVELYQEGKLVVRLL